MGMAVFSIILLAIISVVSNSGATATNNINDQFDRLSCPMPAISGLWNNTGTIELSGATYNYPSVSNQTLTLTCTEVHTLDGFDYAYGSPTVAFAGSMFFIGDWISELIVNKLGAFFTILFYILTPANFEVLGFTIADLSGFALMAVIGLYAIAYIFIGVFIYKTISPFAGVG